MLADDWTYIDQYGTSRGRQEYIELVERAIRPDHSTVTIDLTARLLETVAIATGRYDVRGVIDGHEWPSSFVIRASGRSAMGNGNVTPSTRPRFVMPSGD